jgi:hypothetical protein
MEVSLTRRVLPRKSPVSILHMFSLLFVLFNNCNLFNCYYLCFHCTTSGIREVCQASRADLHEFKNEVSSIFHMTKSIQALEGEFKLARGIIFTRMLPRGLIKYFKEIFFKYLFFGLNILIDYFRVQPNYTIVPPY